MRSASAPWTLRQIHTRNTAEETIHPSVIATCHGVNVMATPKAASPAASAAHARVPARVRGNRSARVPPVLGSIPSLVLRSASVRGG